MKAILIGAILTLLTLNLNAEYRVSVTALRSGTEITDGEVCFYPYEFHQIYRGATGPGYRCYQADKIVALPPQQEFAFFVRAPSGLISANPIVFTAPSEEGFRSFAFEINRGGSLDVSAILSTLADGEQLGLVFGGTTESAPFGLPVVNDQEVVPANVPFIPIVSKQGKIIEVGSTISIKPGESHVLEVLPSTNAAIFRVLPADPVTGEQPSLSPDLCEKPYSPEALEILLEQSVPTVEIVDGEGVRHQPILSPEVVSQTATGVYVFRELPTGPSTLVIDGGRWIPLRRDIELLDGVNIFDEPVFPTLGSEVEVILDGPMALLASGARECEEAEHVGPTIALSVCDEVPKACHGIIDGAIMTGESMRLVAPPGSIEIQVSVAERPIATAFRTVSAGTTTTITFREPTSFYVMGRVTLGGVPIRGNIRFRSGWAVSDLRGEYVAVLHQEPGMSPARFISCDQTVYYHYKPAAPIVSGAILDINIPQDSVFVTVEDADDGQPLTEASTLVAVLRSKSDPDSVAYFSPGVPEEEGFISRHIDPGEPYRVCAELRGYERTCTEKVRIKKKGRETVALELTPIGERTGRVLARGYHALYWTTAAGIISESAQIDDDGAFWFRKHHGPGEFIVLVGDAPLIIVPQPAHIDESPLEIPVAIVDTRNVVVRPAADSSRDNALVGVWLDGVRVPHDALLKHQLLRQQRIFVVQRQPAFYSDLAAASVRIAIGPDPHLLPPGTDLNDPNLFRGLQLAEPVQGVVIIP